MNQEVRLAKKLLESKGYEVSKMNESDVDDARDEYRKRVMRHQRPNDPVGYPDFDEEAWKRSEDEKEERHRSFLSRRRKEEGAPDDYEYNGALDKFIKKTSDGKSFDIWNESAEITYTDDDYDDWQKGKRNFGPYDYEDEEPPFPFPNDIDMDEHLEVSAGAGSTTAEKVAYVKKMVEKAKNDGDEHSAWDIVDFLYGSMLLDKIPLDEAKEMNESETEGKSKYTVYYVEAGERGDIFRHLNIEATDESEAEKIALSKFREWSSKDIYRIEGIEPAGKYYIDEDRDYADESSESIKGSIKESIRKVFSNKVREATDEYGRPLAELPASDPLCAELRSLGLTEEDISPVASSDKYHEYHGKSDFHRIPISYNDLESNGYEHVDTGSSDYTSGSMINYEKGYMITLVSSSTGYVSIKKLGPTALEKIKSGEFDFWNDKYSE